jgi:hypothetical protein
MIIHMVCYIYSEHRQVTVHRGDQNSLTLRAIMARKLIDGSKFWGRQPLFSENFERVFDRLIEILAQNIGVFRPVQPENPGTPPRNGSTGTPPPSKLANAHQSAGRTSGGAVASPGAMVIQIHKPNYKPAS